MIIILKNLFKYFNSKVQQDLGAFGASEDNLSYPKIDIFMQ